MEVDEKLDDKKASGVADHLSAPRKKKKDYVVLAVSDSFDKNLQAAFEGYIRVNFKTLAVVRPASPKDLQKLLNRDIVLLIVEDQFIELDELMNIIQVFKSKRREAGLPVLFLTDDPDSLISAYHGKLGQYQETDSYMNYRSMSETEMLSKISNGIKMKNARRSRRYTVDVPLTYFNLSGERDFQGKLVDLSVHGAVIRCEEKDQIFKSSDQLRINLPIGRYGQNNPELGDFLKISAKVRRIFIGGNEAAISWEYLSEHQLYYLTEFLTSMVNAEMINAAKLSQTRAAIEARNK